MNKALTEQSVAQDLLDLFDRAIETLEDDPRILAMGGIPLLFEFIDEDAPGRNYRLKNLGFAFVATIDDYDRVIPAAHSVHIEFDGTIKDFLSGFKDACTNDMIESVVNRLLAAEYITEADRESYTDAFRDALDAEIEALEQAAGEARKSE